MPKYENIFSPETMTSLKGKSADSLRQMLGNKNIMRAAMESQQLIDDLAKIEEPYRDELEMISIQMVKDVYPVIDKYGIEIDAKLVGMDDVNASLDEEFTPEQKRRIVNGITQGAAVRGTFSFLLFREYIDDLDPTLIDKYKTLMNNVFGSYNDDNAIAMFLSMIQQGHKMGGGSSKVKLNESSAPVTIIARAICFPMLVHEIIKGLYELLSLNAFTGTKQQKQDVVNNVDKLSNEPHDLKYGKFIYDALSNVFNESEYDDPRIRELFFTRVYKLPDNDFLLFIENAINGKLTSSQKNWAFGEMRDINSNFKKDDTGLEDLDELQVNNPNKTAEEVWGFFSNVLSNTQINPSYMFNIIRPCLDRIGIKRAPGLSLNILKKFSQSELNKIYNEVSEILKIKNLDPEKYKLKIDENKLKKNKIK